MFNISKYLSRVSNTISKDQEVKERLISSIKNTIKVDIPPEQIEISNYIAQVNTNQALKNKIFIHKEDILKEFKNSKEIVDIN